MGRDGRRLLAALALAPLALAVMLAPLAAQAVGAGQEAAAAPQSPEVMKWGFIAAALVTGLSALGAAYAVAVVGGAAMGAVAEKPETAGRALVFVGLAEGIAIYGLIVAIMILGVLAMKLVAVGRAEEVRGFALAGVTTMVCDAARDAEATVAALTAAGSDVGLLIVPPWIGAAARTTIAALRATRTPPVVLVLPDVIDDEVVGA